MKLLSILNDKSLSYYVGATGAVGGLIAMSPLANAADDSFDAYKKQNGGDKTLLSADGTGAVESSIKGFINIIKWVGLLIGIVLVIGGLLAVKKASATEGQKSTMPGWMAVIIGGLMTIVTTIAVVVGRSAEGLAGVQ